MTLVVNLYSGPGAGKSTTAALTFGELKSHSVNCEYVQEYAKDLVWGEQFNVLSNQIYVFGKQYQRMPPAPNPLGLPQSAPVKMKITKSSRFEYQGRINGPIYSSDNVPKVDFIDIEDASQKPNASVEDYFEAVPIDIQAIALDWRKGIIWGDMSLSAIKWREIRLKNATKLLPNLDTNLYMRDKAESLGFQINTDASHRCYCYPESPSLLFINGCKCGGK